MFTINYSYIQNSFWNEAYIQLYITSISFLPVDQKKDSTSEADSISADQSAEKTAGLGDGGSRFVYDTSIVFYIGYSTHQRCIKESKGKFVVRRQINYKKLGNL